MADESGPGPGASPAGRRRGPSRGARIAAIVAGLAVVGAGLWFGVAGGGNPASTPSTSPSSPAVNPLTGEGPGGHVLAVKIDNVGDAQRIQSGLNSADLVYVIQVEGGLSRYLVVFDSSHAPARVGPVRSARQTDIPLLAPFGRVGLAYSGAISGLLPDLAAANLQTITPITRNDLFSNGGSSPTYIQPAQIFAAFPDLAQTQDVGLRFGPEPAGGTAASSASARMPSARFAFTASGGKWLVSVDGHAVVTIDAGQANADNVIIQHVQVVPGKYTDHNAGHADNEVFSQTTGQGSADFYRDGKVWHGQWSKPSDGSPTSYTVGGTPMNLAPGRTWIVLEG
ncbi:DUF3048 domain-containing protein [Streptacidiphilus jiangxiensis]|uniref:DUF3048 domain-containing protein n=1 Tax=Streptacidiphilus jiangxiensis TaxID=235985 RepID=A0A1H7QKW8_STRJI|nr:DUF3048 domain-containing protein [Streptacidiphilus jiangxiensis]SEL48439.1 Protein of unknown function [Streptacidiphilus jiangxiensis]